MRGVVALACALLVSLGASGCFVSEDDPEAQDADGSTTTSASSSATATNRATASTSATGTSTAGAQANRAPTATLSAATVNGTAPLNVTFTIGGSDADGDALTWTLSLDNETIGNGTAVPANLTHAFTEAGNYTVVLTVSDGALTGTANVTVAVSAGAAAAPGAPALNICEAPSETSIGGEMYVDRVSWIFLESNGLPGLQYTAEPSLAGEVDSAGVGCENGDTLLF